MPENKREKTDNLRSLKKKMQNNPGHKVKARRVSFATEKTDAKNWFNKSAFLTSLGNAFNLLFPEGEKYFIRHVKNFLPQIEDKKILEDAKGFIGQEMQHSIQHEKFWQTMQEQGYEIDSILKFVRAFSFDFLEPMLSDKMNLSTVAGFEHYTALLAEIGLENDVFRMAEAEMQKLYEWHAAEELEHKSVAFDVLQEVDDDYLLRISGMLVASAVLFLLSSGCMISLLQQDKKLFSFDNLKDAANFWFLKYGFAFRAGEILLDYFRPDFHPWQNDNLYLARKVLDEAKSA